MTVYLLDQVQKGKPIFKEAVAHLRKHKLVEGRINNLYLAAPLAKTAEDRAQYIKNKLKRNGIVTTDSDNKRISHWILVNYEKSV